MNLECLSFRMRITKIYHGKKGYELRVKNDQTGLSHIKKVSLHKNFLLFLIPSQNTKPRHENKCAVNQSSWQHHFLFILLRAFHSPSWLARLPYSAFTFLFLSASLKHKHNTTVRHGHDQSAVTWHGRHAHLLMMSLSFSRARKRVSFRISLSAPLNSRLYLCWSRSRSFSSLVFPRFLP